jgi:hypothetical protein
MVESALISLKNFTSTSNNIMPVGPSIKLTDYTWNLLIAGALGTFPCKPKILETELGNQLQTG